MRYAVYEAPTPNIPIAIYQTEDEAISKAKELNKYLLGEAYLVKPYAEEIQLSLTRREIEVLANLCAMAIKSIGVPEKMQAMYELENKLRKPGGIK